MARNRTFAAVVKPQRRTWQARYAIAIGAPLLAVLARISLDPLLDVRLPLLTFYPAVMVSAWYGGLHPGIASTALSALLADYLWFEPRRAMWLTDPGDVVALFIFVITGVVISGLNETLHRGKAREEGARLAAEQARRQAEAAERRVSSLIEGAPTAIVAVNSNGTIVLVNALTEQLFGYTRAEMVGQSVEMLVPERFRHLHPSYRGGFVISPQMRQMGAGRDLYGLRKDGTEVPVEIGLNPIGVDGEPLVLSSIVDITDRRRAEDERVRLLEAERLAHMQADAANRSKDLFIARASHELRTPLNALMGWTRMLCDGSIKPSKVLHAIESIDRTAQVLKTLVDDLIDMSRFATGRLQLDRRPLDIVAVSLEAVNLLRMAADAKGITLETDIRSQPVHIDGDATRLRQVLWNLVSNAIKFTPTQGRVLLRVQVNEQEAEITVSDTGQGIEPHFLPHVFEPFSQAEIGGQGLGLGLAIVQQLVQAHDGRITVTSSGLRTGTTFTVSLPLIRIPEAV